MAAAGQTVSAEAANEVTFSANQVTSFEARYVTPHFRYLSDVFVSDHHRNWNGLLSPRVPVVDVNIGAAY
jgi:hypothetical protein